MSRNKSKSSGCYVKGMLIGLLVGAAVSAVACELMHKEGKQLKKGAKKAVAAMEELVAQVEDLVGTN